MSGRTKADGGRLPQGVACGHDRFGEPTGAAALGRCLTSRHAGIGNSGRKRASPAAGRRLYDRVGTLRSGQHGPGGTKAAAIAGVGR